MGEAWTYATVTPPRPSVVPPDEAAAWPIADRRRFASPGEAAEAGMALLRAEAEADRFPALHLVRLDDGEREPVPRSRPHVFELRWRGLYELRRVEPAPAPAREHLTFVGRNTKDYLS